MTYVPDMRTTPCPPWCDQVQCQEPNPADRGHQRMAEVPVVFRKSDGTPAVTELVVVIFTSSSVRDEVWVAFNLGEGSANLTFSIESAERLRRQLAQVLSTATRGDQLPTYSSTRCRH